MNKLKTLSHKVMTFDEFDENKDYLALKYLNYTWDEIDSTGLKPRVNNTIITFDSETSNYEDENGNKKPFIFSLMTTIMNPDTDENINVWTRTIDEFKKILDWLVFKLDLEVHKKALRDKHGNIMRDIMGNVRYDESNDRIVVIYIHNLPFDISFLLPELKTYKVFAQSSHKPYYVETEDGIMFKDSVVLSQKTLEQIGKGLKDFNETKKVGDFDYDLIRTPATPFTEKEKGYVIYDTTVLAAYIKEEGTFTNNVTGQKKFSIAKIPLTQTGKIRQFVKKVFRADGFTLYDLYNAGALPHTKPFNSFRDFVEGRAKEIACKLEKEMQPSGSQLKIKPDEYYMLTKAYTGGFTHSNPNHTGEIVKNVQSWDFTSSYPTRIVSNKFAMSNGAKIKVSNNALIKALKENEKTNDKTFLFEVELDSISSKVDYDYFLSVSKADYDKGTLIESNGRIVYAENVRTTMLSTDWETFSKVYKLKNPRFHNVYMYKNGYLPLPMILSTLYFYKQKTTLKGVKGKEKDYMNFKERLNSIYGMCVQNPIADDVKYNDKDGWTTTKKDKFGIEFTHALIDNYNNSRNRFLAYIWGVQISAYSRRELWKGIMECGDDYIYSDTDSIKVKNSDRHEKFIADYNKKITEMIYECLDHFKLDRSLANPEDIKGNRHPLGVWDANDGFYKAFKTLGAKRYVDIDKETNKFEITIAGLSKEKGKNFFYHKAKLKKNSAIINNEDVEKIFSIFNDKLFVPAKSTGKLAHYYVDKYDSFEVKDYKGNSYKVPSGGGCLLKPTEFTLSLSESFMNFLYNISNGYVSEDIIKNIE